MSNGEGKGREGRRQGRGGIVLGLNESDGEGKGRKGERRDERRNGGVELESNE